MTNPYESSDTSEFQKTASSFPNITLAIFAFSHIILTTLRFPTGGLEDTKILILETIAFVVIFIVPALVALIVCLLIKIFSKNSFNHIFNKTFRVILILNILINGLAFVQIMYDRVIALF